MSHPSGTRMIESNMTEFGSFYTELANLQTSDKISYQPTRPATIRKRSREIPLLSVSAASDQDRASKIMRWEDQLDCASSSPGDTNPTNHQMAQSRSPTNRHMSDSRNLSEIQKTFIRHWFESFADGESHGFATHETINALATLVQASPQPIFDYINREFSPQSNRSVVGVSINRLVSDASSYDRNELTGRSSWSNSFMELNRHLPPATLALVEKYVSACRRRRPQTDGRRSVNDGPFRCTFGCGYQTKRAFDWRRHEETHEPQELWLCTLCSQNKDQSPLLVNRKDKFLKHAKDGHPAWEPETVLDMSRVDFKPRFDPSCPFCADATSKTWDERCRHVLEHFEVGTEVIPQSTSRKEYKERKRQSI